MYILNIILATLATADSFECPQQCRCDTLQQTVYCLGKGFIKLPFGIPQDTKTLYLQNNRLVNGPDLDKILCTLQVLTKLDLSNNSLTSFPENLPPSLTWVSMKDNDIRSIGSRAVARLSLLGSLNLDNNKITNNGLSESFGRNALRPLIGLRYLDLSRNRLTYIPKCIPNNITSLCLSHNLIKSVNEPVTGKPRSMSLSQLIYLEHLDLSYNRLRCVEPGSLDRLISLKTVLLHENPWQCDSDMIYLNTWISTTPALMSMQSNTVCFTPEAFQGVTLQSLDCVSLTGSTRQMPDYNISVSSQSIVLQWGISNFDCPNDAEYSAFCGVPRCANCTQKKIKEGALHEKYTYVSSIVKSYTIYRSKYSDPRNKVWRIDITSRTPNKLYIVCMLDSSKDIAYLTIEDCEFVDTKSDRLPYVDDHEYGIPVWLVILIALLVISVLSPIVIRRCIVRS